MAMTEDDGPRVPAALRVAAAELRAEPVDYPEALTDRVLRAAGRFSRPGLPVAVRAGDGSLEHDGAGSRTSVSERVLGRALGAALETPDTSLDGVRWHLVDGLLERVEVDVVVRYGLAFDETRRLVRDAVAAVVQELLGVAAADAPPVDVTVTDVTTDRPSRA